MKSWFSSVGILMFLAFSSLAAGQSAAVVQGNPPLTEETIGRFTEFFEWAFDVRLTNDQCAVLRRYTVDAWTQQKKSDMDSVLQLVQQQVELSKLDKDQRAFVRLKIEPELLADMRRQPDDPMARWALAVYASAHQVIAAGDPPLTRQSTDAFLEALYFMAGEVAGRHDVPDAQMKNEWANALAANYAKISPELKKQIAGMPLFVTAMRLTWPTLPESEKAEYRQQWTGQLKALLPPPSPAANGTSSATPSGPSSAGSQSVAAMMAEQNRRHQMFMSMSSSMMRIHQMNFNTIANWGGSPYRYW